MNSAKQMARIVSALFLGSALLLATSLSVAAESLPIERTEERELCADYDVLKRPMFGDLHVHTSYSHDSYTFKQRNDPRDAYRYAKGEAITLSNEYGDQTVTAHTATTGFHCLARNALKDGLMLEQKSGVNPFKFGFIGSTDTHSATAGGAEEDNFVGHLGWRDAGYRNVQDHFFSNPGGLAVVWAEENSRDAIFNGLRQKEAYATSGTRPTVRFFAGAALDKDLCESPDMVAQAYRQGVAMGGEFSGVSATASPRFLVSAQKDPGIEGHPGTDLQRIQIIKGWVDARGATHERVYDVAGNANNSASVNPESCMHKGPGFTQLCKVWDDPQFDAGQATFYYARVLENPTCRWSTLHCQAAG